MSILTPGDSWPPKEYAKAIERIQRDDRTILGKPQPKQHAYTPPVSRFQYAGGIAGAATRALLGRPQPQHGSAHHPQHDELPAALATLSADVLVGTPPRFTIDDEAPEAQEAIDRFTGTDRFAADLHNAFRTCAGLGWVYGRVVWNQAVSDHPWVEWVDPDGGMPIFSAGKLTGVIFWDTYARDSDVYRLLQRHTPGRIEYELYKGTSTKLGTPVPYTELPETAYLAELVDENLGIDTGTTLLTAVMLPNLDRDQEWRGNPTLRHLGTSDTHRGGAVWEQLDKLWTDLLHEIDSARARLLIPEEFMQQVGPGNGMVFEWFRDVFPKAQGALADEAPTIDRIQFEMRVADYAQAIQLMRNQALSNVGWSGITFGADVQATGDLTATEVRARSERTLNTHKAKSRHARAALGELITAWVHMDAALNGYTPPETPVNVAMAEPVQNTERDEATVIGDLRTAGVLSLFAAVERLHPEWTVEQIEVEVQRIREEQGTAPDPGEYANMDEVLR